MKQRLALSLFLPALLDLSCRHASLSVRIVSPASETEYAVGETVRLSAEGVDRQGQALPDSASSWRSSIDGPLGTVREISRTLSPGFHKVEVEATDPGTGEKGSDRILVLVTGAGGREGVELVRYMSSISKATLGVPLVQVDLNPITLFGQVTYTLTPAGLHNHPGGYHAAIGNGRMAVAFTREGTLNLLRWPSPSYFDQVDYLTSDRNLPRKGALPNMGSFAGVIFKKTDGTPGVAWTNDSGWTHRQAYLAEDANIVVTESEHAALGLVVKSTDLVLPGRDVLARRFRVERRSGSPVTEASFVYFENFAPATTKFERLPLADWLLDPLLSDFAAAYDARDDLLRPAAGDGSRSARSRAQQARPHGRPPSRRARIFTSRSNAAVESATSTRK